MLHESTNLEKAAVALSNARNARDLIYASAETIEIRKALDFLIEATACLLSEAATQK
jgi:hypothetical protein